jgi:putative ABC transport system permease protein
MNIRVSLNSEFDEMFKKYYDWEIALGLNGYYPIHSVESRVLSIPGVVGVESQTQVGVQRVKDDGSKGASFTIVGLPPDSDYTKPDITNGRWLQIGDRNAMVMTSAMSEDMPDLEVGSRLTVKVNDRDREFEIVGIIPQTWEKTAYVDMDYMSQLQGVSGLTSSLFVRTEQKDGPYQTAMAEIVEQELKDAGIKVGSSITQEAIVSSNAEQVDFLIYFLLIMAILSAIIGALGMMGMMGLNVMERTREIGVMRSIGAASFSIGSIVITEGLIIGIVSWIIAIPVSIPISFIFNAALGNIMFAAPLKFMVDSGGIVIWLIIVMMIAFIACLMPAYRAMRMSVRETLAYE